mmetsp:Transcript_15934/g.53326  ORF Transcript_15934/g.53326 Transcript_15934/m.53326 type:complete len:92 (-) Transcript_15934:1122-1397(-)
MFWSRATQAVLASSVCIVVGTSLQVAPANLVPGMIHTRFGKLIVCNLDDSGKESADVFLQGRATETLPALVEEVRRLQESEPAQKPWCSVQ